MTSHGRLQNNIIASGKVLIQILSVTLTEEFHIKLYMW